MKTRVEDKSYGITTIEKGLCGFRYEYRDSYVEAIGHDYHVTTTAAGCETEGYVEYTCAVCGDSYRDEYTAATGHLHNAKIIRPTCVAYGYTEHICETCGDRYVTDYVKPTGHNFTDEVIPAGKDTIGFTKHTCEVCGYHYLSDFVTSGDDGYIPTEPEIPDPPDISDVPDEPDTPSAHEHNWVFAYEIHATDKYITLDNACECGEHETAGLQILCTDKFGNNEVLTITDEGQADYRRGKQKRRCGSVPDGRLSGGRRRAFQRVGNYAGSKAV